MLERYIVAATLRALGVVSAGLTALFSLLEFVDQLHDVGRARYRLIDALFYVLLTAPARLLQLMPTAMLLACLFALGMLATRGELTAMRASGMSPARIVGSVFKLAGYTLVALLLMAEFVIPPAQRLAQSQRSARLSTAAEALRSEDSFWAEGDHQYLNVRRFAGGNIPSDIWLYQFASTGELQTLTQADHAEVRPDGSWLLKQVTTKHFDGTRIETERLPSLAWRPFLRPRQASLLILPPDSMQPIELYEYVRELNKRHQPTGPYAQALWTKINIPLAMAAMIMIAVPFVFGPLRTRGTGQRMVIGIMIGIVFSLIQQITTYLGQLLTLSPALTATAPSVLLMALAIYLFRRTVT